MNNIQRKQTNVANILRFASITDSNVGNTHHNLQSIISGRVNDYQNVFLHMLWSGHIFCMAKYFKLFCQYI